MKLAALKKDPILDPIPLVFHGTRTKSTHLEHLGQKGEPSELIDQIIDKKMEASHRPDWLDVSGHMSQLVII